MNIQHIKTTWKLCHSILSRERFASNKQFNFLLKKKIQSKRPSRSPEREKMRDSRIFIYLFIYFIGLAYYQGKDIYCVKIHYRVY
jgi:hypothetical protein